MTDSTPTGHPVSEVSRRRSLWAEIRFITVIACIIVILGILIGGHIYGRFLADRELGGRENAMVQLRDESQKLKLKGDDLSAQITQLQTKLDSAEAALQSIMPSKDTYNINPNQTLVVADGHITVGLVGSPGNDNVTLYVNGKQQTVAAGQLLTVAPDPSTNCQVGVQTFDMFKAVLTASCTAAKPQ